MKIEKAPNLRGTRLEKLYFDWLHNDVGMCCLSLRPDALQIAHTGGVADGKGMGFKAPLWTCLPLHMLLHHAEERDRRGFWSAVGFEPGPWAARLFDIFENADDPRPLLHDMHEKANKPFLAAVLGAA